MSGASYTEEHLIDSGDDKDDPYDLGLTLEETEDDFNIEDITEDQVKEILADEENRFLLEDDDPIESTSSQINIIDRRVNDKPNNKGKSNDSKSFRNSGNLITIDCDDEEEDEDESEIDDRRHSKFKSERVIKNNDKKADDKDIPETLEAVVLEANESHKNNRNHQNRGNYGHHYNNNQRGYRNFLKGRNFVPSSRPFIGNNSLSSMGLLPTPLQSFNRIHVNPNFKPLANQGSRLSNPMNDYRQRCFLGGMNGRMSTPHRPQGPRHCFPDLGPSGAFSDNSMISDPLEALVNSQRLPEHELREPNSSHHFSPNNTRPPLFNEPFSGNWSNHVGMSNQPWMKHNNRPSMDNFQRIPGLFNSEPTPRSLLLGSRVPVNNSLFGSPQRHLMQPRFSGLPLFNQPSMPQMSSMEFPGNRSTRIEIVPHPVPALQRHQIPLHLIHNAFSPSSGPSQGQNRPSGLNNSRPSVHQDNKKSNHGPIASTSGSGNYEQLSRDNNQFRFQQNEPKPHFSPMRVQDSTSPHHSINKVTTSPSQRNPRPSTSNVNLKNIRQIKTIGPSTSTTHTDARKAALLKTKAARRFLQKENMNRIVTSVKQIEVVDLDTTPTQKDDSNEQSKQPQPMVVDLEIDEDYKKKLEEQKRLREEIIKKKEERRKQMVAEKMKQGVSTGASTSNSIPSASTSTPLSSGTGQQRRVNPLASTLIERVSPPRDVQIVSEKNTSQSSPFKRKSSLSSDESIIEIDKSSSDVRKVEIKGLALTTTKATITKLCTSIGPIEDCVVDVTNSEKKATVTFKTSQDARAFQSRFQRHLVDLCVIQVSLLW